MASTTSLKIFAQLQRELQEYRTSLLLTPACIAGLLVLLMLGSVIFAGRVSIIGDGVMQVLVREEGSSGLSISINVEDMDHSHSLIITEEEGVVDEEEWNFSGEWTFSSRKQRGGAEHNVHIESLNPVLNVLHALFLVLMFFVSINYLLGSLYQDCRPRRREGARGRGGRGGAHPHARSGGLREGAPRRGALARPSALLPHAGFRQRLG